RRASRAHAASNTARGALRRRGRDAPHFERARPRPGARRTERGARQRRARLGRARCARRFRRGRRVVSARPPQAHAFALASSARAQPRLAWLLLLPMLAVVLGLALFPLLRAFHDSLHLYDLRRPWLGRPFVGALNYETVVASARFWGALGRTLGFVVASVSLE